MNEKNIEYRSENFYIRKTDDRDYDNFRKVCEAEYLIGRIYKHQPKIAMKCFWETLFEGEDIHYSIFLQDGEFLGRVSLQYGRCKYPEIAIVVVKKYQNQGYGFKLLKTETADSAGRAIKSACDSYTDYYDCDAIH